MPYQETLYNDQMVLNKTNFFAQSKELQMAFLLFKATSLKKVCFQVVLKVFCCNGVCVSAGAGAVMV